MVLVADGDEDDAVASGDSLEVGVGGVGLKVLPGQLGAGTLKVEFVALGRDWNQANVTDSAEGELDVGVLFKPLK